MVILKDICEQTKISMKISRRELSVDVKIIVIASLGGM